MMPPGMMSTEQIYGTGYLGMMEMMQSFMDGVEGTSNEKTMAENLAATRVAQEKNALNKDFKQLKPLGLVVGESDGDEYHKVAFPIAFGTADKTLYSLVGVEEGQKVTLMNGKSADARERTARVAKQVLRTAGFDIGSIAGSYSFNCSMYQMLGGPNAMQTHAEKLADTLGDCPTLGMLGGPEYGTMGDGCQSAVGSYMYSTIVFSTVPIDTPMHKGTTFASGAADGVGTSMLVNRAGSVLVDDNVRSERESKMSSRTGN